MLADAGAADYQLASEASDCLVRFKINRYLSIGMLADAGAADYQLASGGSAAELATLKARVKELEMEQSLMQRELDGMSDVAQRTDVQLRQGCCA